MMKGRVDESRPILPKVGVPASGLDEELGEIRRSLENSHREQDDTLFRARYRRPISLAVALAMFNQLSGINALMYYAPKIFEMAGAGKASALLQSVAVGGTNLVFTMLAMAVIDHFGRRRLILVGSVGYLISLGATAWAFYTYGTEVTPTGKLIVLGRVAPVHRLPCFWSGGGDLGLHQRDPSQPGAGQGAGPGQRDPLGHGRVDHLDLPADRQELRVATSSRFTPR